jgi:hypothetical protein
MIMPGPGYVGRGWDTKYYSMIADNAPGAGPGMTNPSGMLARMDSCWLAVAVAFKAAAP